MKPEETKDQRPAADPWTGYRWAWLIAWVMFPTWLIVGPILFSAWERMLGPTELVGLLALLSWGLPWLYFWNLAVKFRCPRCGEFFFISKSCFINPFRRTCPHCHLSKYSLPDRVELTNRRNREKP